MNNENRKSTLVREKKKQKRIKQKKRGKNTKLHCQSCPEIPTFPYCFLVYFIFIIKSLCFFPLTYRAPFNIIQNPIVNDIISYYFTIAIRAKETITKTDK